MRSLLRVQSLKLVVSYAVLFAISIVCFTGAFAPGVAHAQTAAAAITAPLADAAAPMVSAAPDVKSALLAGFIQYVLPVLFTALATLLGWVFVQLGKKYGTEAGTAAKNQAFGHLFALAQSVVADLEATLKPQLLAATSDGVLSPDEITALRNAALVRLKALAGEKGLAEAQFILGIAAPQLEGFLMGLIERAVDAQPRKGGAELLTALGTKKLDATLAAAASGNPS